MFGNDASAPPRRRLAGGDESAGGSNGTSINLFARAGDRAELAFRMEGASGPAAKLVCDASSPEASGRLGMMAARLKLESNEGGNARIELSGDTAKITGGAIPDGEDTETLASIPQRIKDLGSRFTTSTIDGKVEKLQQSVSLFSGEQI